MKQAVITGMGAVSPYGRSVSALWDGLLSGQAALRPTALFDASAFRNPVVGAVDGYPSCPPEPLPRSTRMLLDAVEEALRSTLNNAVGGGRVELREALKEQGWNDVALILGSNFGGLEILERKLTAEPPQADLTQALFGAAARETAVAFGLHGSRMNVSLSCASGAAAIGLGRDLIRSGRAQVAVVAGYDALSLYCIAGLNALRAITPDVVRPFDRRRQGTIFAEGAGAVILEEETQARLRGARLRGAVSGAATNNDAFHLTAPDKEEKGRLALLKAVLADAACRPESVDLFNLHATGTKYNDAGETKILLEVFGPRAKKIPVTAVKSAIGHTMGAAGVLESIVAIRSLETGLAPPVLGLDPAELDLECALNIPVGAPAQGTFRRALKLSAGFGGTNAALILSAI
jgi:3-oxoacyl-[acyl-carrier-protein] synthase II